MKKISCILIALLWGLSGQVFAMTGMQIDYTQAATGGTVNAVLKAGTTAEYILTATSADGYRFLYWVDANGDTITNNPRTITHGLNNTDETYNAVFVKIEDVDFEGGLVAVAPTTYTPASMAYSLSANAGSCGVFTKWNNESTDNPIAYTSADGTRKPTFTIPYDLLIKHEDGLGGTIEVTTLNCGFTLKAIANTDYKFVAWGEDAEEFGSAEVIDVDYLDNKDYSAGFTYAPTVATRGGENYESLQTAVDAISDQPVIIINDVEAEDVVISNTVTIDGQNHKMGNLTIALNGDLTLSSQLKVKQLLLNTTTGASSQLSGENYLTYTSAAIDIQLQEGEASPDLWYAFAVPFHVDVLTGIRRASAPDVALSNTTDYLCAEYDGLMRAGSTDGNGWKFMYSGGTLNPGQFYMIGIDGTENTWRFISSDATISSTSQLTMPAYTGSAQNGGWNAMANTLLTHADAATNNGIAIAQVYENGATAPNYKVRNFSESSFVMASPFFVQVSADDQLNLTSATHATLYAPARHAESNYYRLQLLQNSVEADVIYLTASEDAMDTYEKGMDVVKLSTTAAYPHIFTCAYGLNLCAEDAVLEDGTATYDLTFTSPVEATYALALNATSDEVTLWNGSLQIWNFNDGEYQLDLPQGTTNGYVLQVHRSRGISTDYRSANESSSVRKYLRNGQLYIRVNDQHFNVQGVEVR